MRVKHPDKRRVLEGMFSDKDIHRLNLDGYNVYWFPNGPKEYDESITVDGSQVDTFNYIFVDYDCKSGSYPSKSDFILACEEVLQPSLVVDSGNGVHAYWKVSDLDAFSYLRLTRRMMRRLNTDEAVGQLLQLMRLPGTINNKSEESPVLSFTIYEYAITYTCEEINKLLPPISLEDEQFCEFHYKRTHELPNEALEIDDSMPAKWGQFLSENSEAKTIWTSQSDDRSRDDFRLAHLMFAAKFSKEEALRVLLNSVKAMSRAPAHRYSYALNIVEKIWIAETTDKIDLSLSQSVEDILKKGPDTLKGTRFPCHPFVDSTDHGFRLGQVLGLVAGSGVGKTAFTLNMFRWFVERNPDYHHFFVPLEQPANEIADRWQTMCGVNTSLHRKVQVLSNYDEQGNFRHLSLDDIRNYIEKWQKGTGHKVGCVVIDHIGALKKRGEKDEKQDLITICHAMKAFAVKTNTFLVMQSQSTREKAGIGDLELDKNAAYGTVFFESYCDYLVTLWQPVKRCHKEESCPTVSAFKFCKIRHKKAKKDTIKEDVPYYLYFDSDSEQLRNLTQDEEKSFDYFLKQSVNKRKQDKKTEILRYVSAPGEQNDEIRR